MKSKPQLHYCPKILNIDTGYDQQTAYNYLRLLKSGCQKRVARDYSKRKRCQVLNKNQNKLDMTKKEIGPHNYQILKPIFDGSNQRMGWQAAESVKFKNDEGVGSFIFLSSDIEKLKDTSEFKILKMYQDYANKFEKVLRDRIELLNQFIDDRELKLNLDKTLDRGDFVQLLKSNTFQLRNIAQQSYKYVKFKGIKLFEIVTMLESDIERKQYLIQESDSIIELPEKQIYDNKFLWDLAAAKDGDKNTRGSRQSAGTYFFPKKIIHQSLQSSIERVELSQVPLTKQFGCFDPWFSNIKHKNIKIKSTLDHNKKFSGLRCDINRQSSTLIHNELKEQSELISNLLNEGGLGDSIDKNKLKEIKIKVVKPKVEVLDLLKGQNQKQDLATEFNQSQYLYQVENPQKEEKLRNSKRCKKDTILDFCLPQSMRDQFGRQNNKLIKQRASSPQNSYSKEKSLNSNSFTSKDLVIEIKGQSQRIKITGRQSPSQKINTFFSQDSSNEIEQRSSSFKPSNFDAISEQSSEQEPSFDFDYKMQTFVKGMISKINQKSSQYQFVYDKNISLLKQKQQSAAQKVLQKIEKPRPHRVNKSCQFLPQNIAEQTFQKQNRKGSTTILTCYSSKFSPTNYVKNKISYKNVNKSQE